MRTVVNLIELAASGWCTRAIATAIRLGIPDLIAGQARKPEELAEAVSADPAMLQGLLRMLVAGGVVVRDGDAFALSDDFAALRADHPATVRNVFTLFAETYDDAWAGLAHTVRTGESGYERVFGVPLYDHLDRDAEAARTFDAAMAELARPVIAALLRQHDFSGLRTVVDVGGGSGSLLREVLTASPGLRGVVADRETVCRRGTEALRSSGNDDLNARLSFTPSDFFTALPTGGDRYLLKNVLFDWSDQDRVRILRTIADAMTRTDHRTSRLLVVEPLEDHEQDWSALTRAVFCGSDVPVLDEHRLRTVLAETGFDVLATTRLDGTQHTLVECCVRLD
ncbi:O-methyltransferase [Saccharopolyspora antimicrobica]|uniref:O-methyltransferase n=1 Tax=Saccharopolyspora antimicrobica TaxID=455193 RepID=A0A1I5CFZ9_9PSEU|nr:methyltransferase [Saccharopolyspora antimicrobica]RKT88877.1 hydroxyneurosporene-O-methyltransferase [Saccharopolyspora antimicrobica]SFN85561.1 O-methyltransferase [Saccharopolyspora antimicrobica]